MSLREIFLLWFAALVAGQGASALAAGEDWRAASVSDRRMPDATSLSHMQLVRAALVAEGATPAETEEVLGQWQAIVSEARGRVGGARARRESAAWALALVYERVATGRYLADCTSLRRAFREGVYNCVSITILYQALCDELGLATTALARPGHVLCRVWLGEGPPGSDGDLRWLRVETTCREWFEPGRNKLALVPSATGSATGLRPLTPAELLAKIHYNRGVELLHQGDYPAAVAVTELAWRCDPADDRARDNHLAALNNGALALVTARRYEEARQWLARARGLDPGYALLPRNEAFLYRTWVAELRHSGDRDAARRIAAEAARVRPELADLTTP